MASTAIATTDGGSGVDVDIDVVGGGAVAGVLDAVGVTPLDPASASLAQAAPPRAPTLAPSLAPAHDPVPVQHSTHQHQRDPAPLLAPCQEPVAAAAGASEGAPHGQPLAMPAPIKQHPPPATPGRCSRFVSSSPSPLPPPPLASSPLASLASLADPSPLSASPPLASPPPASPLLPGSSIPPLSSSPSHQHHPHAASMPKMIFSDLYKSPKSPFSKFRHLGSSHSQPSAESQPHPEWQEDYGDPDLISRDKAKQKEAVRRYLAQKIKNDWDFAWPSNGVRDDAVTAAAATHARAVMQRIVRAEQIGLRDPNATFASPLMASDKDATTSLAAVSADVAAASAVEGTGLSQDDADALDSDAESVYSVVSEDAIHFRPRGEWMSDFSDDEKPGTYYQRMPAYVHSPFRFESPDAVGTSAKSSPDERQAAARRDLRAEMVWNEGLACFTARRDAWTGARTVSVKSAKPFAPASPTSPRRSLFRFHTHSKSEPVATLSMSSVAAGVPFTPRPEPNTPSTATPTVATWAVSPSAGTGATPLSPVTSASRHSQHSSRSHQSQHSQQSTVATTPLTSEYSGGGGGGGGGGSVDEAVLQQSVSHTGSIYTAPGPTRPQHAGRRDPDYTVETLIPVAAPLLPPGNPMRMSITPALYLSLYDKLVSSSLQPSCPINLGDMIRACVAGWKRDNEWPPRNVEPPTPALSSVAVALRKKRRDERREVHKDRRTTGHNATRSQGGGSGGSGLPSPGFSRRMSSFLSGRPAVADIVLPTTTTATADAAPASASAAVDDKDDGMDGNHGIRRGLQRVLGLGHGYVAHNGSANVGTHGHARMHSVGTVGQNTNKIG